MGKYKQKCAASNDRRWVNSKLKHITFKPAQWNQLHAYITHKGSCLSVRRAMIGAVMLVVKPAALGPQTAGSYVAVSLELSHIRI